MIVTAIVFFISLIVISICEDVTDINNRIIGDIPSSSRADNNNNHTKHNNHNNHNTEGHDVHHRLPVVFVYTVVPQSCEYGLPSYIRISIEQSIFSQPDCDVILLSNIGECAIIADSVKDFKNLEVVDSLPLVTPRTANFQNISLSLFNADYSVALWITSALRFFMMEDLMIARNYTELLHIEADNMMYGRITTILPILRSSYPLAATPLNCMQTFITASVFWVGKLDYLVEFNNYLLALGHNLNATRDNYIDWLRPFARKKGGAYADADGNGVKPFAINEMSMLAYYHLENPLILKLLPVVPAHTYNLNRHVCNMSIFGPEGHKVGPSTGHGIWDANSWGQYLGGTSSKKGRDKGFTDGTHVSGQAIRMSRCRAEMICANISEYSYGFDHHVQLLHNNLHQQNIHRSHVGHHLRQRAEVSNEEDNRRHLSAADTFIPFPIDSIKTIENNNSSSMFSLQGRCYSAPFVQCGDDTHWTPLWNLHVHSKHTQDFKSELCECQK